MTIELPQVHSGKVRELYDAGDGRLLMVASDRVSAFDVVMDEAITNKGRVLTAMTTFWCDEMADVVPGSQITADPVAIADALGGAALPADWAGRAVLVPRPRCSTSSASCVATWPAPPTSSTSSPAP